MRYRLIAVFSAVLSALAVFCIAAKAEEAKNDVKGLFLLTDYPAVTLRPGTTSSINLKLQNYGLPPERLALSVTGVPAGWTATLIGNGQPVAAALPATNGSVSLELRLDVPKDAPVGTTALTVNARGASTNTSLPVSVTLATDLPASDTAATGDTLPFLITVDDGGVSYYTVVADRLERLGWRGHCFVTTDMIGQRGFLTRRQIRELDGRGHIIGSHSASHPTRCGSTPTTLAPGTSGRSLSPRRPRS